MVEIFSIPAVSPAARGPAAATYTILVTAAQNGVFIVHVCNTTVTDATFRIAHVEAAFALPGGNTPNTYHFTYYDYPIAAKDSITTSPFTLNAGDKIVVYTDTAGVVFTPAGPML